MWWGLAFAVLLVLQSPPQAQAPPPAEIAAIEGVQTGREGELAALDARGGDETHGVPGLTLAVIRDFEIQWTRAYGVADVVEQCRDDTDTLFQAASISKPITAMAILKAVSDKRFTLDDDVNKVLVSWKVPPSEHTAKQPVTLRGLLSHTSGTDDGFGFPGYKPAHRCPRCRRFSSGNHRQTSVESLSDVLRSRPSSTPEAVSRSHNCC